MFFWKGRIRIKEGSKGLVKMILERNGLKPEENDDIITFWEEKDPFYYPRSKAEALCRELREAGAEEVEINGFSIVDIFTCRLKGESVEWEEK